VPSGRILHMRSQVEEAKRGIAKGTPVAIQQHQDIITVNYPARAAGVKKHMRPAEVRHSSYAGGRIMSQRWHTQGGGRSVSCSQCTHHTRRIDT